MRVPLIVPEFDVGEELVRLGEWAVTPGDSVFAGECLTEFILPGLAVDLLAPASGQLIERTRQPEQRVYPGEVVGWIETGDDNAGVSTP
jgi:pyruvate/2-oxoglutarate dehydrogenase complex dihydrolipoamide acyltransferase (E2) component